MKFMPLRNKRRKPIVSSAVPLQNQQGLTLVEVLVTTAILSLILALIYGTLVASLKAKEYAERIADLEQSGLTALDLIVSDVESAFIYNQEGAFFSGTDRRIRGNEADTLSLTTCGERNLSKKYRGPTAIAYFIEPDPQDGETLVLLRRESPFGGAGSSENGAVFTVVDNVRSLNFQYFDGEAWQDSWGLSIDTRLPAAVKIDLVISFSDYPSPTSSETALEETFSTTVTPIIDTSPSEQKE